MDKIAHVYRVNVMCVESFESRLNDVCKLSTKFCNLTVAHKCQSSYRETRNTTIGCVVAGGTFATQRMVVLWSYNTTIPTQNPTTQPIVVLWFCVGIVVLSYLTHNTTICCVVADNSHRNKLLWRQNMKPIRNGSRSNSWSCSGCGRPIHCFSYPFILFLSFTYLLYSLTAIC